MNSELTETPSWRTAFITSFRSESSAGISLCFSCSSWRLRKAEISGETHSSRYFCSSRGMPAAMALKSGGRPAIRGSTTPSGRFWQCSQRPSIQSESSCRSSMASPPLSRALLSATPPWVGTRSCRTRTRKRRSEVPCRAAPCSLFWPSSSKRARTYCTRTPMRRTSSSRKSPRDLALMLRPKRRSNLSKAPTTPSSRGIASAMSKEKPSRWFVQKCMNLPRVFRAASRSEQTTSHWSTSMPSWMSVTTPGMCASTCRKYLGLQKSGWEPRRSS
mmetsp:Transcript_2034/g.5987  ORF Transcript_2034/g.5987 Transcript_2034/m.5987 type:complete len:274 (+) Transcript_2034:1475-2296(+)